MSARLRAIAAGVALALPGASVAAAAEGTQAVRGVSALDLIELQIGYTTIVARYYKTVAPRTLVDGARTGIEAELARRGIDAMLPFTPARVDLYGGGDLIDTMLLKVLATYGKRVEGHALVSAALSGELAALHDPYSLLFHPEQFKKFNAFLGNTPMAGIGAILSDDDVTHVPIVERVISGSPAAKAGIRSKDAIVAVDGHDTHGLGGAGLVELLRGKAGTIVHVRVAREGVVTEYVLTREPIHDLQVTVQRFGDVGYLGLARFGDRAGGDVADELGDLKRAGVSAVVLDLRDNGGGYGDEATSVASSFLTGPVFSTRERNGATTVSRTTGHAPIGLPVAVLVNGDTASAAEIVAGAIQDDHAGIIIGTRTFGKGVVQSVFPLPDGSAFKLTTGSYTTPSGRDINGRGIDPDIVVPEPAGAVDGDPATDPQLAAALARLGSAPTPSP